MMKRFLAGLLASATVLSLGFFPPLRPLYFACAQGCNIFWINEKRG